MAINKTKLTGVEKVYPLNVSPYEQYMGDFKNPSVVSKINAMIQSLHQIGRLTNETVSQWNNVMKWIVEGGMDEIAETVTNEKVSVALEEVMRMLDVSLDNGLKELAESVSDKKIGEMVESGQFESIIQSSLVELNEVVENKLVGFNLQLKDKVEKDLVELAFIAVNAKIDGKPAPEPVIIKNLWDVNELVDGLLSITSGNLNASTSMRTTPFKDVLEEQFYTFSATPSSTVINFRYLIYGEGDILITGEALELSDGLGWTKTIKTPVGVKRIRVSAPKSTESHFTLNIGEQPMGDSEGDIWDGGFWDGIPTPPLRESSVNENHLNEELRLKINSVGSGGGTGGSGGDLGKQLIYQDTGVYAVEVEKVIANVANKSVVDIIEFSTNSLTSELKIYFKEEDGTEKLYDLISTSGDGYLPSTIANLQLHGSAIVDFIEFDDRNNVYKIAVNPLNFANGFKVAVKNTSMTDSANMVVRVVSRQYV